MKIEQTKIKEVLKLTPKVFQDDRGFFMETYRKSIFEEEVIDFEIKQENHSKSIGNVVRGLHYQTYPNAQAKLVRCITGAIFDVAVDIRFGSPTFGEWVGVELSAENKTQLFIPHGFAHGFCTLTDTAEVEYKVDGYYSKDDERSISWNDKDIDIDWPIKDPVISEKDLLGKKFKEIDKDFMYSK